MFDDLESIKRKVEKLQREADKAAGAYDSKMKQIKEEFGCKTLEDAEAKLADLEVQEREAFKIYGRKKKKWMRKHKKAIKRATDGD